jgi:hypothetical protein
VILILMNMFAALLIVLMASGVACAWRKRYELGIVFFLSSIAVEFFIGLLAHFGGSR